MSTSNTQEESTPSDVWRREAKCSLLMTELSERLRREARPQATKGTLAAVNAPHFN